MADQKKVWVLNAGVQWEGSRVINVFADEETANRELARLKPFEGKYHCDDPNVPYFDVVYLEEFVLVSSVTTF